MEENKETKIEQPVIKQEEKDEKYRKLKRSNSRLKAILMIVIFTLVLAGILVFVFCCGKKEEAKPANNNQQEKKEEACNCPNDKKPTEENRIIKAESNQGMTLYQTEKGYYLSIDDDESKDKKEYVIGDRYVYAYKVDFTGDYGSGIIDSLSYGNGGGVFFVFVKPNNDNSYTVSFIDQYSEDIKDNMKPVTNDKLKNIAYVYSEAGVGASDAYAVTVKGEKINLYDFVKKD